VRILLIVTAALAVLSWAFFAYIVLYIPPKVSGHLVVSNLSYFFLSGFLGLAFTTSIVFYFVNSFLRQKSRNIESANLSGKFYLKSIRRGFLLAFLVAGLGVLKVAGLLNLLNGALLIGCIALIEFYFSGR
jgi:hypothetical protein